MADLQSSNDLNVRSADYYVARTSVPCRHCGLPTRLLALALPPGHETLDADAEGSSAWQPVHANAFLFYVQYLPDAVRFRLEQHSPFYRLAYSEATLNSYWANHCEHCGRLLGDHELHCEPDGAFMPSSETEASNVQLLHIEEPFAAAAAGYALEPEFFAFMR